MRLDSDNLDAQEFLAAAAAGSRPMRGGGNQAALEAAAAYEEYCASAPATSRSRARWPRSTARPDARRTPRESGRSEVEPDPARRRRSPAARACTTSRRGRAIARRRRCRRRWTWTPPSSAVVLALAEIYEDAEQTEQAVLHYRKALELEPDNLRVRLKLGDLLLRARAPTRRWPRRRPSSKSDAENQFALDIKGRALRDLAPLRRGRRRSRTTLLLEGPERPQAARSSRSPWRRPAGTSRAPSPS